MADYAERTLTPKLRFPEFREEAGWNEIKLKAILDEHRCKSNQSSEVHSVSVHKGVVNQKLHLGRSFAASDTSNYNLVKPNDVVYTKSPTGDFPYGIVKLNYQNKDVIVSPLYGVFSPSNKHLGYILDAYFESAARTNDYLESIVQKGAKNTIQISNETFLSKGLFLPYDEREQQKIAACLRSLDELVTAQKQKVEALKIYKKGLMQQLFPCEGKTLYSLRFPKFRNAPQWEERNAGQLFANRTEKGEERLPLYSVTMNDGLVKRSSLDRRVDDIANAEGNKKVCTNDIAYNMMRMWQGACGVAAEDCMVSPAYVVLSPQADVYSGFFWYLLKLPQYLRLLTSHSQGLTEDRLRLYYKDFARIPLLYPSIREQEKIANFLTSIDSLILAAIAKLASIKAHKEYLMQQLFPLPKED